MKRVIKSLSKIIPDKLYLSLVYYKHFGHFPNFRNPQTFNEKIQWLKLYDRNPEYTKMVDKYAVKKYIAETIGSQYVIPTLGVWDRFEDIDFDKLPNRFVLKCTHDSGGVIICKDKSSFDIEAAREKITRNLGRNLYYYGREWPYKNVPPRIIAEKYMEEKGKIVPEDYKIYCINGEPKYIVIFHNRFNSEKHLSESVYDVNWVLQPVSLDDHFDVCKEDIPRPECLDELLHITRILCKNMSQVRIDFYIIEGKIYFGEITFHTASGFQKMIPESLDFELGKLIRLPEKRA